MTDAVDGPLAVETISHCIADEHPDSELSDVNEDILRAGTPGAAVVLPAKRSKAAVAVKTKKRVKRVAGVSGHPFPALDAPTFGLIQESIAHNLYFLVVQAILWNQTAGRQARPIFVELVARYPTPRDLSRASLKELTELLQPLGLHNIRARRCIELGKVWTANPPIAGKVYRRKGYPVVKPNTPLDAESEWEIAHLPGVGPYALDSYRIFHRDEFRGLAKDWLGNGALEEGFEPEWKRVLPLDKELKAYLKWRWLKEGWKWDPDTGRRTLAKETETHTT